MVLVLFSDPDPPTLIWPQIGQRIPGIENLFLCDRIPVAYVVYP